MARIILNYLIPLLLPMLMYFLWVLVIRKKLKPSSDPQAGITRLGIFWAAVAGVIIMLISIITVAFMGGAPPGKGQYESPRLENGKIVPPKMN
jgi:heme/copper-type cytochrome/quinol oxidase subunit 2